ncbi:MAG: sugar ABC transporter permease, partial [Alphaproteobacteria bacterium]
MTARSSAAYRADERAVTPSTWSRIWSQNAPGYMFLLPWFIGFFGLTLGPMISSLYLSFTDFDLLTSPDWVGTANYIRIFTADPKFAKSMQVTFFFVASRHISPTSS